MDLGERRKAVKIVQDELQTHPDSDSDSSLELERVTDLEQLVEGQFLMRLKSKNFENCTRFSVTEQFA